MRLGVLDIGSNTVHLLLVDAHIGAKPEAFASHKRPLSLVRHLDSDGAITVQGQEELIGFIDEAARFAARHRAEDLLSFCTSAIREATNGDEVLARVAAQTDVELMELTGAQESAMTFLAARRWRGWSAGHILNFDIGGGSFEIAYGQDELPTSAMSVPLGAGRLTRDWLPDDPPTKDQIKALKTYVREEVEAARLEFPTPNSHTEVLATSKTFRSLARMTGAAPSAAGPYEPRVLTHKDLKALVKRLGLMSAAERAELPGVSTIRARQVFAGALVAETAMRAFGVEELQICPWALREGLILRRLDALVRENAVEVSHAPGVGHVDLARELNRPRRDDVAASRAAVEHAHR
ncbi:MULTISPECIES: Ppx/GppA family phosphatase [Nesterenkonia]|uniref:Exopolyphosphatase/guanosine-5'-triphosphate, 3'-diphosphate pyrophosphatase n=1 Tax=Nesterenkonia xinjiangensis TaxID=225327 RepID=A0A7Z0GKI2_9MICC|nr:MULTISPECIES: Ppx/GppA family phosphatase [Nesterenkonia]MDZ5077040.1 Ppx/GppA family phosphatase [Nesterenkonia sp. HG001]NYJ77670.1 exopolyphosphatase/guanosine-5'-triphosphate,3'-diphosphate pyrophosphatase [Nesterenkonia xinjiangensis]